MHVHVQGVSSVVECVGPFNFVYVPFVIRGTSPNQPSDNFCVVQYTVTYGPITLKSTGISLESRYGLTDHTVRTHPKRTNT